MFKLIWINLYHSLGNSADDKWILFFAEDKLYFMQIVSYGDMETICIKWQNIFSALNKKAI